MDAPATGLTLPPLVSVIIPTFNRSNALRYAIRSAIGQRFQDFEVLVIGDACTDDSEQVVAEASDPRLHWYNLEQRHGRQYGPVNAAMGLARGRYMAYLGHDDLWLPGHLEHLVRALEESRAELAYSAIELIWGPDSSGIWATDINGEGKREAYFRGNFIHPSCLAFRRDLVDELGPWLDPAGTGIAADWEFVQRACRAGKRFAYVPVLTAIKFPALSRPGVYEERPCHEQASQWGLIERYGDGYASLAYQRALVQPETHAVGPAREIEVLRDQLATVQNEVVTLRREIAALRRSITWRATEPIRRVFAWLTRHALILRKAWARLPIRRDQTGAQEPAGPGPPGSIPELVEAARARLDPVLWDYACGGAESEVTLRRNRTAMGQFAWRSRALTGAAQAATITSFLGYPLALPVMLAPVGPLDFFHPDGALASARAAHRAGTAAFVGMLSSPSLQEVRQGSRGPLFFQLYAWGDRDWLGGLVGRVEAAGYHGICLTVDAAAYGRRERDLHNRHYPAGRQPNLVGLPVDPAIARQFQANLTWEDLGWLRGLTRLPIMLKGVLCAEDAALAVDHGVDVVYVSNHGGRQLDHAQATIEVLPEIAQAVGGKAELLVDGGFLRGSEVATALALGARAVLIGKLQVWGLAGGGEDGLVRTLELLREEIATTMAAVGAAAVPDLGPHLVVPAPPLSPGDDVSAHGPLPRYRADKLRRPGPAV